ncbi:MAG: transglycosylase SLT domain-containing protein [Nevskia sp.]|nr:transglycosylase SLT domain-containing protein [Nevskia sp.]
MGRELRAQWLPALAQRRDWGRFLQQYRAEGADTALRCDWLAARIALRRVAGLEPVIADGWLSGRDTPEQCGPAFAWLRGRGLLTPSLVDRRARLALAAGNTELARQLAHALPPEMAPPILQWAALIERPRNEIDGLIEDPARGVESAALQDGWQRLARSDPDAALARFQPLLAARHLDPPAASQAARALALGLALSRRPQALDYFAQVAPADLDQRSAEWQLRAALWKGDWPTAAHAVEALPPALREQPRWRYWAARSAERQGQAEVARTAYAQLAAGDGFFAALAAARQGQALAPHDQPQAFDQARAAPLARRPALLRAHELLLCELRPQAAAEWQAGLEDLDPAARIEAAGLAYRWGWWEQAIATAARQGVSADFALLYPLPYDAPVQAAAATAGVGEELIYAMLRQESLYDPQAQSRAGALGLLQLLPDTAQRTARRWHLPVPREGDLLRAAPNLALGAAHLRDLLDRFGGQVTVAVAAYNAGAAAASRWLPEQPMDADAWIENIPFNETRDYVQRIGWHRVVFGWRRSGRAQDTRFLLGQVAPAVAAPGDAPP